MRKLLSGLLAIVLALPASARILHVPEEYPTIQEGIDAAENGDTVLVAPGEYWEDINPLGRNILITSGYGPDTTIIQGYVRFQNDEDTTCAFRGLTLIGQGNDPTRDTPPVILVSSGRPKIIGNMIRGNTTRGFYGGGIGIIGADAIIRHNIIENNWSVASAGGIGASPEEDGNIEISHNIIRNNSSGFLMNFVGAGAGIYCSGGSLFYNVIYGNEVLSEGNDNGTLYGAGGGIYVNTGFREHFPIYIHNNTIVSNKASLNARQGKGGGIYIHRRVEEIDTVAVVNNIVAFNDRGGVVSSEFVTLTYNLFYENADYDLEAPDTSETNIFDEDPLFVDTLAHDYHLLRGSPCIDAGDPNFPLDPDSTRADIGAFYFDQTTDMSDDHGPTGVYDFQLRQNYPNPFNAQTTISYRLKHEAEVSLKIFDVTGRIVKVILEKKRQEAGSYRYLWDGTDSLGGSVTTAIYFYELTVDKNKQVKTMMMLR